MNHNDYFYLGMITKPFGYKGQVNIYLDTDEPEKYANLRAVFIEEGGEYIPYMIEEINLQDNHTAIVKFADIDGEAAKSLVKSELYLPLSELPPLTGNRFYYHEVTGFAVVDEEKGKPDLCLHSQFGDLHRLLRFQYSTSYRIFWYCDRSPLGRFVHEWSN